MSSMKNGLTPREKYWRSLDQLADTPEFKALVEREFPENASEMADPISRRNFLALMGASIALAGLASCRRPVEKIIPYVIKPEEIVPGLAQTYATAMPFGNEAFGAFVRSNEGRPTKIDGNPGHASTAGAANVWMQSAILGLYDPDRSQSVSLANADRSRRENKTWEDFVVAWRDLYAQFKQDQGAGLAILSESFASPTLARLQAEFEKTFPKAMWVTYEPVSDENIYEGVRAATGVSVRPIYDYANARVIVSLESDFLYSETDALPAARGFAAGRRVTSERDSMNRLYVAESSVSVTGGLADHRLRVSSGHIGSLAVALGQELSRLGFTVAGLADAKATLEGVDMKWVAAVAKDLAESRGASIVVAGRRQPAAVHALVCAINDALGNTGETIVYQPLADASVSSHRQFADLVTKMNESNVTALVMIGGNPVYNAPADWNFASALEKVRTTIHFSPFVDETSSRALWHVPSAHFLEGWGDVRAVDGTASVVQPLIEPLYGSKTSVEFLTLLTRNVEVPGYDVVRETWKAFLPAVSFESQWRSVLHDGVHDTRPSLPSVKVDGKGLSETLRSAVFDVPSPSATSLELSFQASATLFDGRFANNGWLQELPDPITKITWDNVALISPTLAKALDIRQTIDAGQHHAQMVRLTFDGRTLDMPVWIQPGQADYTVTVALGYGRTAAGRVGNDVGFDTYTLRSSAALYFGAGAQMAKVDRTYTVACVQDHGAFDEEALSQQEYKQRIPKILREATLAEYRAKPNFASNDEMLTGFKELRGPDGNPVTIYDAHVYDKGYQWGMSIDLNACIGCNACTIACQSENNIPVVGKSQVLMGREMHWIRMDRYFKGPVEDPQLSFQPMACHHCETAPCEQVCPVAATVHDSEGLNVMVYNRCVGTRYCANNCPYKVRRFNFLEYNPGTSGAGFTEGPEVLKLAKNPDVTVRMRGVMEKCTYCVQRISGARIRSKKEGREIKDGEVVTACQQTCPTQAIVFGNINDPNSAVSKAKAQNRNYALLEELNVRPRTSFLAKLRNPNPALVTENVG